MTNGTTVINDVLSRIRDSAATLSSIVQPPTTASGRAFILNLVNYCAIYINIAERILIGASDLLLSSDSPVYDLTQLGLADYGGTVLGVFVAGVGEIDGPVDFHALGRTSRTWLTDTNATLTKPLAWSPIGNTLLVLYPMLAAPLVEATIRYIQAPTFVNVESNQMGLPDYAAGHLARLTALVASIKTQQLTDFDNRLNAVMRDLGIINITRATGGKAS